MKVLFVTREYPPFEVGGVAKHTYYLVKYLRKQGVESKVLSFGEPVQSSEEVEFLKPRSSIISRTNQPLNRDLGIPFDILRLTKKADEILRKERFDLVHVEEPYVGALVRFPRKVTTIHDTSYGEVKSIINSGLNPPNLKRMLFYLLMGYWLERLSGHTSNVIITPYRHVKDELLKVYNMEKTFVKVIRNGVELPEAKGDQIRANAKEKLGINPGNVLVFTSAQHVARKRLELLIEAVKLLKNQGQEGFKVVIGGDGPLRERLLNQIEWDSLQKEVHLTGWMSDELLQLYYSACDIFVLTSDYEAGPLTLLEAMGAGTTIVSSKIDGFARLLSHNENGLLFPPGDAESL